MYYAPMVANRQEYSVPKNSKYVNASAQLPPNAMSRKSIDLAIWHPTHA
jgi:hypothetical protein